MAMETYTLTIEEADTAEGITVEIYDYDGMIEESVWVDYADHGLTAMRKDFSPEPREQELNVDVMTLGLQVERDAGAFEFRVLGDGDVLTTERIADSDWRLASAGE